ncbi:MAG: phosphoribosylformylglycinamidine synthase subunit PurL [Candidatus Bilamarchaeaceae archaeon]
MPARIEIAGRDEFNDPAGAKAKAKVAAELGINLRSCRFVDAYNIDDGLSTEELEKAGKELFTDSVSQESSIGGPFFKDMARVEVGLLPGLTDNIGNTARQGFRDLLGKDIPVYYSRVYALEPMPGSELEGEQLEAIAKLLHNPVVERAFIRMPGDAGGPYIPKVALNHEPRVERINLAMNREKLEILAKERTLALNMDEFTAIKDYLKLDRVQKEREKVGLDRKITDVELEAIAQTWSEHCKHKIFNAEITYYEEEDAHAIDSLFKTFIKSATEIVKKPYVVSVFHDNGGIIKFNHEYDIAVKVETHNAPCTLDPYGGALTGILGVNRDIIGTGMGARPIANMDMLCFGLLDEKDVPKNVLHPRTVYEGVVKGIEHGGNKSGIPTVNGSITFEKGYTARPVVYCGTVGVMPSRIKATDGAEKETSKKEVLPGYLAVVVGGRVGKDGIHGATFSSQQIDSHVPQTVVQIGDPITQKKVLDLVLDARDAGLYEAITDNGAGGISSSIGELAQMSNGCEIWLETCPLKYPGLDPWEILVSESQERMSLVVKQENIQALEALARKHDVEMSVVGKFTDSGKFHVLHKGETVAYLEMKFLHSGNPKMKLTAVWKKRQFPEPRVTEHDLGKILKMLLASPNIRSKEWVIRQYDHEVQGGSVVKPLMKGPCDAAVIRPVLSSEEGLVVSHGLCPKAVQDSYDMATLAFDEAVRNALCSGVKFGYMAALDNFSWPDPVKSEKTPDGEYKLAQLVRACLGLYDCATHYGIPFISGKDSMKNDYYGKEKYSIPPTLLVTMVGKMDDIKNARTSHFKNPDDYVYVVGKTRDELGGSEYFKMFNGIGNSAPKLDFEETVPMYRAFSMVMEEGLVNSAHDVSDGGIAVCIAESAFPAGLGADIDLSQIPRHGENEDAVLFSETPGRIVVSVSPEKAAKFEKLMHGHPFAKIGRVRGDKRFIIRKSSHILVNEEIENLDNAWNGRQYV